MFNIIVFLIKQNIFIMKKLNRNQLKNVYGRGDTYHCVCDNGRTATLIVPEGQSPISQGDIACDGSSYSCTRAVGVS